MEEIESEVSFAARIQQSILPRKVPEVLVRSGIDILGVLQPTEIMGGDLYDYFMLDTVTFQIDYCNAGHNYPLKICNLLIADVVKFRGEKPQSDDITVLSIIRNPKKS